MTRNPVVISCVCLHQLLISLTKPFTIHFRLVTQCQYLQAVKNKLACYSNEPETTFSPELQTFMTHLVVFMSNSYFRLDVVIACTCLKPMAVLHLGCLQSSSVQGIAINAGPCSQYLTKLSRTLNRKKKIIIFIK